MEPTNKRQKVLSKVCESCRQKKARCDSARPKCDACRRKGTACIYREKGQPGLRPGFGKALESRLDVLEADMERVNKTLATVLTQLPGFSRGGGLYDSDDNGISAPTMHVSPICPTAVPSVTVASASSHDLIADNRRLMNPMSDVDVFLTDAGLPSSSMLEELCHAFFDCVYPWLPLFQKPDHIEHMFCREKALLLHGLVVVAHRFRKDDAKHGQAIPESAISASRTRVLQEAVDSCTLVSTQALVLLAVDTLGTGTGPRAWNILSMLVASVRHLNITKASTALVRNEDRDDDPGTSSHEREDKKRLFWSIVMLDRFCSTQHGQAGGIQSIPEWILPPTSDVAPMSNFDTSEDWLQSTTRGDDQIRKCDNIWQHYIELLDTMNETNQLLIQPVDLMSRQNCQQWQDSFRALDNRITAWNDALPTHIRDSQDIMAPIMRATYHLIKIRMYTVAAFPSATTPYMKPSSSARASCLNSVADMAILSSTMTSHQMLRLGPLYAFIVWVATRSLVIMRCTNVDNSIAHTDGNLALLMDCLKQMSQYWPCAKRYMDLVHMMTDVGNSPGGQQELDAFVDTRKTTYGLERRLHMFKDRQINGVAPHVFDFLDMPLPDLGDLPDFWVNSDALA